MDREISDGEEFEYGECPVCGEKHGIHVGEVCFNCGVYLFED